MKELYEQRINCNNAASAGLYTEIRAELEDMGYPCHSVPIPVPRHPAPITLAHLIKFWLSVKNGEVRENSSIEYEYISNKHIIPYFDKLGISVHDITLMDIQEYFYIKGKTLKPSTLDKHYTVINGALNFAMYRLNMIYFNPAAGFVKPKKEIRIYSCYSTDELCELLGKIEGHLLEAAILLAANFGLRRSEALGLKWSAVDFKSNSIVINHTMCRGKNGYISEDLVKQTSSYRTFALDSHMKDFLIRLYNHQRQMKIIHKEKYANNDYICKFDNGDLIKPDYLTRNFPKLLAMNELKRIRFHDLRHSAASNLLNAGFSLMEICDWLGHADIRSTQRYLHITFEAKKGISKYMGDALFKNRRSNKYNSDAKY